MFLSLSCRGPDAGDVSFLLHKHPNKVFEREVGAYGVVRTWYTAVEPERLDVALWMKVDPTDLIKGPSRLAPAIEQYVNDHPFSSGSLLSVGLRTAFATALAARCVDRPDLVERPFVWKIHLPAIRVLGDKALVGESFGPLGYEVQVEERLLDATFPEWGVARSAGVTLMVSGKPLHEVLGHLYVLLSVLDPERHYYLTDTDAAKLILHGERWLLEHPLRDRLVRRFLGRRLSLVRSALGGLADLVLADPVGEAAEEAEDGEGGSETSAEDPTLTASAVETASVAALDEVSSVEPASTPGDGAVSLATSSTTGVSPVVEEVVERRMWLGVARRAAICEALRGLEPLPTKIVDMGCGEGRLLGPLREALPAAELIGVDPAPQALRVAGRINKRVERLTFLQGSLFYRDSRLSDVDAIVLQEVIEHIDASRLDFVSGVLFGSLAPQAIVITTPNSEYNVRFERMEVGMMRHPDHRFEWTRPEFHVWCDAMSILYGYAVHYVGVGPDDPEVGTPTQMAVFTKDSKP